ncbi:MAG: hypothetical protein MUF72_13045 [Elainella sp. Prado103]|nr:hypothetical protein [Elainella sp. Prado103]
MIKTLASSLDAIEGPNEWDLRSGVTYRDQAFPEGLRIFQSELYAAIKQDPETTHFDVVAPSIVQTAHAADLGAVPCDTGNMHTYMGSYPSEPKLFRKIADAQVVCPGQPVMATEAGWHSAKTDPRSQGVSESVASKLIPRLWLEFFNHGIQRTFIYELIDLFPEDGDKENRFGLLRSDGSRKPAFIALKNMMHLLADAGFAFVPEMLNYRLEGSVGRIHHTLLQKSNRNFYLILWQEVPAFDRRKRDLVVPDRSVTLSLQTPMQLARLYRPLESDQSLAVWQKPTSIQLQIPDHPLIVELVPI